MVYIVIKPKNILSSIIFSLPFLPIQNFCYNIALGFGYISLIHFFSKVGHFKERKHPADTET